MRQAWIQSKEALRLRMIQPQQIAPGEPEAEMPPYMESFLAHLRVLIGVPFEYLVPDPRLLADESIRFFFLDRSWADRVVDGAIAVGKIGTREQAHHQAHEPAIRQQLDITERIVRSIQMQLASFTALKTANDSNRATNGPADVITGFILRSAAVSGSTSPTVWRTSMLWPGFSAARNGASSASVRLTLIGMAFIEQLFGADGVARNDKDKVSSCRLSSSAIMRAGQIPRK